MGKKNKAGVGHGILKARSRGTRGSQDGQDTWVREIIHVQILSLDIAYCTSMVIAYIFIGTSL